MCQFFDFTQFGDSLSVVTESGEEYSYKNLESDCNQLSCYLHKGYLAICLCENKIGSLVGYCSFIRVGVPVIMLDGNKDKESILKIISLYQPKYLWLPTARLGDFGVNDAVFSIYTFSLIEYFPLQYDVNPDLALLLTTSGSTGSPKLVRLTMKNIESNAASIVEYLKIAKEERPITSLPMYYSFGLSVINSHFMVGATLVLTDKGVMQREFWTFAKEQKATSISGVPYTYEMLKRLRFNRMDLPYIKTLTQAGGKLAPDLVKEFVDDAAEKDRKFIVMYGQTEATARMSYLPFENAAEKYSSIGIAIPGGKFSLIDESGNEIETTNTDGELIYAGKNVSLGYAECLEDLAKGDDNHGVLHTGDIARRDADGFYYITGRMKRFIKIYGNRVNLDASEQIVKAITPDCACVGRDDKMIVYVTDESVCSSVRTLLSEKTGLNNRAFEVRCIPEIPKNDSGKVQYAKLNNE